MGSSSTMVTNGSLRFEAYGRITPGFDTNDPW